MKKLTESDFQTALDECAEKRFKSHGDWLTGMVRRLNNIMEGRDELLKRVGKALLREEVRPLPVKTVIKTGNTTEPEVPCKS